MMDADIRRAIGSTKDGGGAERVRAFQLALKAAHMAFAASDTNDEALAESFLDVACRLVEVSAAHAIYFSFKESPIRHNALILASAIRARAYDFALAGTVERASQIIDDYIPVVVTRCERTWETFAQACVEICTQPNKENMLLRYARGAFNDSNYDLTRLFLETTLLHITTEDNWTCYIKLASDTAIALRRADPGMVLKVGELGALASLRWDETCNGAPPGRFAKAYRRRENGRMRLLRLVKHGHGE